jgi:hypothetical protein
MPQQLTDDAIAKLSPGALRRLLLNLRQEDQGSGKRGPMVAADHDSHVMHGSHSSFGSHGQHTSFSNSST